MILTNQYKITLLRHRVEQEGVSIILRRYGVGRERVIGTPFFISEELGVRSEEWRRRALELLLDRWVARGMISFYIARRFWKTNGVMFHVKRWHKRLSFCCWLFLA